MLRTFTSSLKACVQNTVYISLMIRIYQRIVIHKLRKIVPTQVQCVTLKVLYTSCRYKSVRNQRKLYCS